MIVFHNEGELDVRAIKTMGVNVKENSGAIGYFGTGLKYAIAVLLREGCTIEIFTGGKVYTFRPTEQIIRGKSFDIVEMEIKDKNNNVTKEELGFTTELGKNWKIWMAYRELYSNALDEGGHVNQMNDDVCYTLPATHTAVVVRGKKIEDVHNSRWRYFVHERSDAPLASFNGLEIFKNLEHNKAGSIFYKGVYVGDTYFSCPYDFNFDNYPIQLTEDRTVAYPYQLRWGIASAFLQLQNNQKEACKIFESFVLESKEHPLQNMINYAEPPIDPSDTWLDIVEGLRKKHQDIGININAVALHAKKRQRSMLPSESVKITRVQQQQLERATAFCQDTLGYDISKYKLVICHNVGTNALGRADIEKQIMYLSTKAFDQGTKRVAAVLVEEFVHVEYQVEDETLEQKMVYLEKILTLGEGIQGAPL